MSDNNNYGRSNEFPCRYCGDLTKREFWVGALIWSVCDKDDCYAKLIEECMPTTKQLIIAGVAQVEP